tara:strand:+ start:717 stop:1478 length:762 start_codon:yes stop_codon:yes gene_type:complete
MNLETARKMTLTLIDDPDGQRWTPPAAGASFDSTNEVDLAIQMAAQECVSNYCNLGGDFFDAVLNIASANGIYNFGSLFVAGDPSSRPIAPLMIRSVNLRQGQSYYNIHAIREKDVEVDMDVIQDLKVRVVFTPDFTDLPAANPLRYSRSIKDPYTGVQGQLEWAVFDQWVCTVAAKHLTPKENEGNTQLDERIMMLRDTCMTAPENPISVIFPSTRNRTVVPGALWYRWSYAARDTRSNEAFVLRLHRVRFW